MFRLKLFMDWRPDGGLFKRPRPSGGGGAPANVDGDAASIREVAGGAGAGSGAGAGASTGTGAGDHGGSDASVPAGHRQGSSVAERGGVGVGRGVPTTAVVDRSVLESSPRQLLRDLVRIAQLLLVPVRASHIPRNAFDPDRTARRFFELFTRPVFRMYVLTGNTASSLQWCPCCREGKHTEFGDFYGSVSRVGRKVCKGTPVCGHTHSKSEELLTTAVCQRARARYWNWLKSYSALATPVAKRREPTRHGASDGL